VWGDNGQGQLNVPSGLFTVPAVEISCGRYHTAAVLADGRVVAWGRNNACDTIVHASGVGVPHTVSPTRCISLESCLLPADSQRAVRTVILEFQDVEWRSAHIKTGTDIFRQHQIDHATR